MKAPTVTVCTEGGDVELAGRFEVCSGCDGHGTHTNPSIDGNGITAEEMHELGDDFRADYMSGVYDVTCETCKGARVVAVPNFSRWTREQRRAYHAQQRELAECEAIEAAERRAGA